MSTLARKAAWSLTHTAAAPTTLTDERPASDTAFNAKLWIVSATLVTVISMDAAPNFTQCSRYGTVCDSKASKVVVLYVALETSGGRP